MSCHENFSLIHAHAPPTLPSENSISLLRTPTTIKKPEPEYRKDSEEWSDTALACLLEAYTEKFNQLNRGRDWEEVAEALSERRAGGADEDRGEKQKTGKSVEQCKNKIDNLKKRYKVELQRISGGGGSSHWHWFKQMEAIMGNLGSCSSGRGLEGEDRSGLSNLGKQATKSYLTIFFDFFFLIVSIVVF
ncbi:PREDICTED: uncharacterized protein LOC18586626 [Theobroma cacao]|uniref:Uncharacterized protein LOC18586626 n=1 Tax=Theobroma cacao TaxID=3641 RepID=A0AB32WYT8_THECC|nr:PREDICTED: uncharacterized protein LOC18586626 [Theobroma cacao]